MYKVIVNGSGEIVSVAPDSANVATPHQVVEVSGSAEFKSRFGRAVGAESAIRDIERYESVPKNGRPALDVSDLVARAEAANNVPALRSIVVELAQLLADRT